MKHTTYIILILWFGIILCATAQNNETAFSQYWSNGLAINPAYAGARDVFNMSVFYQKKWTAVEGAPMNITFSAHAPLKNEKVGLGLFLVNQSYGIRKNTMAFFNYAYRIQMGQGKLAFGLKGGVVLVNENLSNLKLDDPTDPAFANVEQNYVQPDFGFGAYYYAPRYFVGFSLPDMMTYRLDTATFQYQYSLLPKYYSYVFTAGGLIGSSKSFKWRPSFLIIYRMDYQALRYDINNTFILFDDRLWVGVSYRSGGSYPSPVVVGNMQVGITNQLMLGYSYDYSLGNLSSAMNGVHEIMLRYEFGYKVNAANPRYF